MKLHINTFTKLGILLCLFVFACKNKNTTPELATKMDEVMAIHDEVMPKTGEIHKLKKKLKKKLNKHLEDVSETRGKILAHIIALEDADDSMMDWMKNYKSLNKLDETADPMKYYLSEEVRITKVKNDMLSSIKNATEFLNQLGDE